MTEKQERTNTIIFLLIGSIGLPIYLYQWWVQSSNGWVCFSRHGNILEYTSVCKTKIFLGLFLTGMALFLSLRKILKTK